MKTVVLTTIALVITALSMPSYAHDPKEHQKQGATAPDCSKMKDMDVSKMNMNDPVMKAPYAKCKKQIEHEKQEHDHNAAHQSEAGKKSSSTSSGNGK